MIFFSSNYRFIPCLSFALIFIYTLMVGCEEEIKLDKDPYVGKMTDFSYSGLFTPQKDRKRVNGLGKMVSMREFRGKFVWADYSGPWCQPCVSQAQVVKSIENNFGDKVVFLTIMTSDSPNYNDTPDRNTANAWAKRFGFSPSRVLAATNLWAWTIPKNILYSPKGQTLFRSTGFLPANQINTILNKYMKDWNDFNRFGRKAEWMK